MSFAGLALCARMVEDALWHRHLGHMSKDLNASFLTVLPATTEQEKEYKRCYLVSANDPLPSVRLNMPGKVSWTKTARALHMGDITLFTHKLDDGTVNRVRQALYLDGFALAQGRGHSFVPAWALPTVANANEGHFKICTTPLWSKRGIC